MSGRRQLDGHEALTLSSAVGPFTLPTSPRDVVPQKVQEISSTFPTTRTFGDPHLYTRRASRPRCNAGLRRSPRRCIPFHCNPTGGTDLAAVVGVNNGGGPQVTVLNGRNEDRRFHVLGASTWTPERERGTKSELGSTTTVEARAHDPDSTTRMRIRGWGTPRHSRRATRQKPSQSPPRSKGIRRSECGGSKIHIRSEERRVGKELSPYV